MKHSFMLGDPVRITHALSRQGEYRNGEKDFWKFWEPFKLPEPADGIVVGERTYRDGVNYCAGWGEPVEFHTRAHYPVLLVVTDIRCKPVAVKLEHVEALPR